MRESVRSLRIWLLFVSLMYFVTAGVLNLLIGNSLFVGFETFVAKLQWIVGLGSAILSFYLGLHLRYYINLQRYRVFLSLVMGMYLTTLVAAFLSFLDGRTPNFIPLIFGALIALYISWNVRRLALESTAVA